MLKSGRIESTDDFLVAGRDVPWYLLFATMGATVIGGGYSIGAVGKTYEWGILMLLVSTGGYLHFIFSGMVVAPRFREAKLYTVAGYFG
ncbi:MAG: sodium:solute symporter family protein, partial [Calditrichaeota bacterium]|nr:sodium:solute symporter family protein [Calditrichota bacterium]